MHNQQYKIDNLGNEILLQDTSMQVMMEWEKPYMEACIDELKPKGNVLEIGFGMGYSATQIQKYKPKSHTIIEMDPLVIKRLKKWSKKYKNINIVEGMWQKTLSTLDDFDEIFFDDYPIEEPKNVLDRKLESERFFMFIDICVDWHMKIGSKISAFMAKGESKYNDEMFLHRIINNPRFEYSEKIIDVNVSKNCNYFKGNKAVIPIIEKII